MNTKTIIEQAFDDAFESGKASALAQLECGKPVLMVEEMGLCEEEFANARGWNSVFASEENCKLLKAATCVLTPGQPAPIYATGRTVHLSID
jgi:hypothetical protein